MRTRSHGVAVVFIVLGLAIIALLAPPAMAPPLPSYEAFGLARDDSGSALPVGTPIHAFIDGVDYSNGTATYRSDGAYAVQVAGNYYVGAVSETPEMTEGGDPGNPVLFVDGDLTARGVLFQGRGTWTSALIENIDLAWAVPAKQPTLPKIQSITTRPADGLFQYAYVCNPTSTGVDLDSYYVQKNLPGSFSGPIVPLTGTVGPGSRMFVNLGSIAYLDPNGDALKLVFRNPQGPGAPSGGLDVVVDRVEFNATGGAGTLTWEPGNTILTDAPAPGFGEEIRRDAACTDTNSGGDFTIGAEQGRAPIVSIAPPSGGERWSGGTSHEVRWDMFDFEDANPVLTVDLAYSSVGGTDGYPNVIVSGRPGTSNPNVFSWLVPTIDSETVRVRVCAEDTDGLIGCGESVLDFAIDSTAPTVLSTSPSNMQGDVSPNDDITIVFSETMDRGSVQAAFSISPDPGPPTKAFLWSNTTVLDDTVTIPLNILAVGTTYTAVIESTATDLSDPPHPLARVLFTFSVAANTPPSVVVTSPTPGQQFPPGSQVPIVWTMSDPETAIGDLIVFVNYSSSAGNGVIVGPLRGATSFAWIAPTIDAGDVRIRVTVIDGGGLETTEVSAPFAIRAGFDPTLVGVVIVVIVGIVGAILVMFLRRRKEEEQPKPPAAPMAAPPPPPMPEPPKAAEAPPAPSTKRCPRCGTTVDAEDLECFRCGHRF